MITLKKLFMYEKNKLIASVPLNFLTFHRTDISNTRFINKDPP